MVQNVISDTTPQFQTAFVAKITQRKAVHADRMSNVSQYISYIYNTSQSHILAAFKKNTVLANELAHSP
jgi:hypothetical protein